jgi:DNA-binding NtrC family response regulator
VAVVESGGVKGRVLIVDDEPDMVANCERILGAAGIRTTSTTDPRAALEAMESEQPDVLLTDLKMPGVDGMQLLERARGLDRNLPVIILTAFATIESAVAAVKQGAFDYLPKPFSTDQLRLAVERALRQRQLAVENERLREQLQTTYAFENIVGRSTAMAQVFELIRKAARSEANILVLGESGTGKELVARAIHANSPRALQAFVAVDCAALPETLLESELFGYEKGAFTGAARTKPGLLEVASGGTVFLDEIAELPVSLQVKFLRALQEREIRRVGGTRPIRVDVRIVSATNRDLREAVAKGQFREELYYRINVIAIQLPPLRARHGDIALLVQHFVQRYGRLTEPSIQGVDADAMRILEAYPWPGNIRELQNVIERACALADSSQITAHDLPEHLSAPVGGVGISGAAGVHLPLPEAKAHWMRELEVAYLVEQLNRHGGNISQAARAAGIDRKTFHRLINKYGIKS